MRGKVSVGGIERDRKSGKEIEKEWGSMKYVSIVVIVREYSSIDIVS